MSRARAKILWLALLGVALLTTLWAGAQLVIDEAGDDGGAAAFAALGAELLTSQGFTERVEMRAKALASGVHSTQLKASIARGRALFYQVRTVEQGLGPGYNGVSCAECHARPNPPGRGPAGRFARVFSAGPRQTYSPSPTAEARVAQSRWLAGHASRLPPAPFREIGRRRPPDLRGLGWIEVVPVEQIQRQTKCDSPKAPPGQVCGWAPPKERGAGSLRFGAKMVTATLEEFITGALYFEHGQTTRAPMMNRDDDDVADPEVSEQDVIDLANYVAFSPPPGGDVFEGKGLKLFRQVGCADCHWGDFEIDGTEVPQFWSDLLVHNLGEHHAELDYEERTPGTHWRTLPLWGLRDHQGPYLTNGSAKTLADAVMRHGGEALQSRKRYQELDEGEQNELVTFLKTL